MRIGVIGACLAALAGVARADQVAPQTPISAAKGKVARVEDVVIGSEHVVLVEWTELAQGDAPAVLPHGTELVPFDPTVCDRYYAMLTDTKAWKVGAKPRDLLVPGPRPGRTGGPPLPWCVVNQGVSGSILPPAFDDLARASGDAILPALEQTYAFFAKPGEEGPLDDLIDAAYRELDSTAALQVALDHRRYYPAVKHFAWRSHVDNFDTVDRAVWSVVDPDHFLVELYWQLSPTRAAARVREEYAKDQARALGVLSTAPPWDEVIDLQIELGVASRLAVGGNERARDFLVAERARQTDPYWQGLIDEQLANFDARTKLGVTDATTLAQYARANPDGTDPFLDMRLSAMGPQDNACDIMLPLAGYQVRVEVDCDAETLQHSYSRARGAPITATGSVRSVYRGDDYVTITLGYAHVVDGYPAAPVVDAGPTLDAARAIDAAPAATPAKKPAGGGCCGAGGDGGSVALGALLLWILRRRR